MILYINLNQMSSNAGGGKSPAYQVVGHGVGTETGVSLFVNNFNISAFMVSKENILRKLA